MAFYLLQVPDEYLIVEADSAAQAVSTKEAIAAFGLDGLFGDGSVVEVWTLRGESRRYRISVESVRTVKRVE